MPFGVLGFVFGDLLFQQMPDFPGLLFFELAALVALLCIKFQKWFLLAVMFGWLWAAGYANVQLKQTFLAPYFEGQEKWVQGVVISLPTIDERRVRFDFKLTDNPSELPAKLRLSWYYPKVAVRAGQHWLFKVKLKAVHGLMNPGNFDYEQWLFSQGVGATGYIRDPEQAVLVGQDRIWQNPNVIRQLIAERLAAIPHLHYPGFLQALTIGKTDLITPDQWQVLRKTGTLHLIAISGSHISLIAGLTYLITWRLQLRCSVFSLSPHRLAAIVSGLLGLGYACLAGFSVPVQRALVMLIVALGGVIWQRQVKLSHLVSSAVLMVLLWDPLAVLAAGFWLSFFAVMLIFYSVSWRLGGSQYWANVFKVHGITALGLAPLLVGFFQQLSLIAPLANLIAVPIINILIVPPALCATLLLFAVPNFAEWLLLILDSGLEQLYHFLTSLAQWHFSAVAGISATRLALCLSGLGLLMLFMPRGLPGRGMAAVLCLPLFFSSPLSQLKPGEFKITLLDVGQGLSTVVQTDRHVLIYDTGIKFSEQSDSGQSVIMPFLASQGVKSIDALVVSHGDNDHIGGAASILAEFKPPAILTSVPDKLIAYSPRQCLEGQHWSWDGVDFWVLGPPKEGFIAENDNSCVLRIHSSSGAVLLTGDIERTAEEWLNKASSGHLQSTVLVAPHHGSNTSSSLAFIQQVAPKLILIPAGYQNQFKFPHPSVLARYQKEHRDWLNVSEQGAITIKLLEKRLEVNSYRSQYRKYWHKFHSSAILGGRKQ